VRITAQLIDAASDRHLWAQRYERSVDDVLGLQSEVARAIAEEIRVKITPHEQGRLARARPIDPEALDAYLRGRYHWNRRTGPELKRSIEHFNRAIELEPGYALAHAGLADAYNILGDLNVIPPQDAAATARAAAKRALELDPSLAEAHTSTGFALFFYDWDWAGAEASYRRALGFNANYATARQWFSAVLNSQGRFEESMAEVMRARELDPLAFIIRTSVADTFYFSRRYDEAIRQLRATIELEPNFAPAHSDLARACAQAGLHDEAIALFERATALSGGNPAESPALAHAYAIAGRHPEARRILERVLAATKTRYVSAFAIAAVYTGLGEPDRAIEWLEGAYRSHDRAMVWLKVHPRLDSLRGDPRFVDLLRRMKFTDGP
jgi:tetratricopeptide (TPR) repeat protein